MINWENCINLHILLGGFYFEFNIVAADAFAAASAADVVSVDFLSQSR